MLIIFICLILIAIGADWETSEKAKERRHKELIDSAKQNKKTSNARKVTRSVAKDTKGNVFAQEVVEDIPHLGDYDDFDDFDDYFDDDFDDYFGEDYE